MQKTYKKVILALDTIIEEKIDHLLDSLTDYIEIIKIGFQPFIYFGHDIIKKVQDKGYKVFLDMKLHDIPNTVENAIIAASRLDIYMLTVHIVGGSEMLQRASKISKQLKGPKILGVTILTSMDDNILKELGYNKKIDDIVPYFAKYGQSNGIDGVISSPKEIESIRNACGNDFLIVTPGIRLATSLDDQKRTLTPVEAFKRGADYIVVGRPILEAKDPRDFFDYLRF